MKKRIITALIGIPLLLIISALGGWVLSLFIVVLSAWAALELNRLFANMGLPNLAVLNIINVLLMTIAILLLPQVSWPFFIALLLMAIAYLVVERNLARQGFQNHSKQIIIQWLSGAYVGIGLGALGALRLGYPDLTLILLAFLNVWITDSAAYFVGMRHGRTPLAPSISPKKTWEGAIAGSLMATLICGVYISLLVHTPITVGAQTFWSGSISFPLALLYAAIISAAGQIGDLLESWLKRKAGVKDSGNVLPGHGGILDRFDSLLLSSIILLIIMAGYLV